MSDFIEAKGNTISAVKLSIHKANQFAKTVDLANFVELKECKFISEEFESVIIDVEVSLGQSQVNDIRKIERICVIFSRSDDTYPIVLALRSNFPQVPHLNLFKEEFPRSLCLYSIPYEELKLTWSPLAFLERIREWLSLTSKGKLHKDDQLLEPFIPDSPHNLIFSPTILEHENSLISLMKISENNGRDTFIAYPMPESEPIESYSYIGIVIQTEPQLHGIINRIPINLNELCIILTDIDIQLLDVFLEQLDVITNYPNNQQLYNLKCAIILTLPKLRNAEGPIEYTEYRAFITPEDDLRSIGIKLDKWVESPDGDLGILMQRNNSKNGKDIKLLPLNPMLPFSKEMGRELNSNSSNTSQRIAVIGVGAIGSQIIFNMVRAGYGNWLIIDKDVLLPHNLARHALFGEFVGLPKATTVSEVINIMQNDYSSAEGININLLEESVESENYINTIQKLSDVDVIIDISTSSAFLKYLCRISDIQKRIITVFLNPSGKSLIILAEDIEKASTIDHLEIQYYRCLINNESLSDLLQHDTVPMRYSVSCSDISSRINQDSVALNAALGSNALKKIIDTDGAFIGIWKNSIESNDFDYLNFNTYETKKIELEEWSIYYDDFLLNKVSNARSGKLPKETGGILIGSYDMERKIIYLADTILSPKDSIEWPTHYIRGIIGLKSKLNKVEEKTLNNLSYVGEWHSHPDGSSCSMSTYDEVALGWQFDEMTKSGYPALMLIVGQNEEHQFYIAIG